MNTNRLNVILNVTKFVLFAIGVVVCLLIIGGPNAEQTVAVQEEFRDGAEMSSAINYTFVILIISFFAVVFFFLVQLLTNTKKTIMSIAGLIVAAIVYVIFWAMGSTDTNESLNLAEDVHVELSTIRHTTAGIYTIFVSLVLGALVSTMGFWRRIISIFIK